MNTIALSIACVLLTSLFATLSNAFVPVAKRKGSFDGRHLSSFTAESKGGMEDASTRRNFLNDVAGTVSLSLLFVDPRSVQAKLSQESQDKEKIVKGYRRLSYLLDNWEKETTSCNKGQAFDTGCERTPEIVMDYLGYKNMDDPLFRADKTLMRLRETVPTDRDAEFGEAFDKWVEQADEANGMAYVSSWGEANPGGGKDRVAAFLERSKNNVQAAHDSLGTVVRILDLNP